MALDIRDVDKTYHANGTAIRVLRGASMSVNAGEIVHLRGPSGSGKSTLLHIAGLLARPDAGDVRLGGQSTIGIGDRKASALRAERLGFVFQAHNLFAQLTALENVLLPCLLPAAQARVRAMDLLSKVDLMHRANLLAGRLSGGEQQRVAIARALVNRPAVLLADEPTAGLDDAAAQAVLEQLRAGTADGHAVLIASHDLTVSSIADRVLTMLDGRPVPIDSRPGRPGQSLDGRAAAT